MQPHSRKAQQCPNIVYSLSPTVTAIHHQLQPESERLLGGRSVLFSYPRNLGWNISAKLVVCLWRCQRALLWSEIYELAAPKG